MVVQPIRQQVKTKLKPTCQGLLITFMLNNVLQLTLALWAVHFTRVAGPGLASSAGFLHGPTISGQHTICTFS